MADDDATLARAVRRARLHLLPLLLLLYVASYLDRANIGYAKPSFQAATGITDAAFALGAGVFFLTYALLELPSNLMLRRIGARRWLARIAVTWGLIATLMAVATTDASFVSVRLLLGAAEAGFFPGAILYLSQWFPARERGAVLGLFYLGAPIALTFGGPISGALLDLDGTLGLRGYQWLFGVQGAFAVLVGLVVLALLPDRPAAAAWMPAAERDILQRHIDAEDAEKTRIGPATLGATFRDWRLAHYALAYMLIQTAGYGVVFYLPTEVGSLLHARIGLRVGVITAIPWLMSMLAALTWPRWAARRGHTRSFCIASLLAMAAGLVLAAHLPPVFAIVALCVVTMGQITAQPIFWTFPASRLGGIAAAGSFAVINAVGNLGGFLAPTIKTWLEGSLHSGRAGLYFLAACAAGASLLVATFRSPQPVVDTAEPHM